MTISRLLQELHHEGLVTVLRRGGRWRTKRRKVVGRATVRRIDIEKLIKFGSSSVATWSPDLVATPLHDPSDLVATPLHADADHVVTALLIKTGTYLKTGTDQKVREEHQGKVSRKSVSPQATTRSRLDLLQVERKKLKKSEVPS